MRGAAGALLAVLLAVLSAGARGYLFDAWEEQSVALDDEIFLDFFDGVCVLDDHVVIVVEGNAGWWKEAAPGAAQVSARGGLIASIKYKAKDVVRGKWCLEAEEPPYCSGKFEYFLVGGAPFQEGAPVSSGGTFGIMGMRMETRTSQPVLTVGKCFPELSPPGQKILQILK